MNAAADGPEKDKAAEPLRRGARAMGEYWSRQRTDPEILTRSTAALTPKQLKLAPSTTPTGPAPSLPSPRPDHLAMRVFAAVGRACIVVRSFSAHPAGRGQRRTWRWAGDCSPSRRSSAASVPSAGGPATVAGCWSTPRSSRLLSSRPDGVGSSRSPISATTADGASLASIEGPDDSRSGRSSRPPHDS